MKQILGTILISPDGRHQFICDGTKFKEISPDDRHWRGAKPKDWKSQEGWEDIVFKETID